MTLFEKLIHPGATVIEIGGHIGFISQYFSKLVGPDGQVVVFEPGTNNLPYITRNIAGCANIVLERMAVSDQRGTAIFYEDNITGQNNSLLPDYAGADCVSRTHGQELIRTPNKVQVITLDDYLAENGLRPDFVKIDIEGFEFQALRGMSKTLANLDALMVEVTQRQKEVSDLLKSHGFVLHNEACEQISVLQASFAGNVFAVRNGIAKPV